MQAPSTTTVNLNSRFGEKINGNKNSHIKFGLKSNILDSRSIHTTCCLHSAIIPCSWYVINDEINEFKYTVDSVEYTLTIPEGNYSASSIVDTLNDLSTNILFSFSSITNKITITHSSSVTILNGSINYYLGYDGGETGVIITAQRVVSLGGVNQVKVYTNMIVNNIDNTGVNQLLASINVSNIPTSYVMYTDNTNTENIVRNSQIQIIEIELKDENDIALHLNGADFQIEIRINETLLINPRTNI
jgi:hypothetical protein